MKRPWPILLVITLLCGSADDSLAQRDSVKVLRSIPANSPILDGFLEAEWWSAPAGADFVQREPKEGEPATQRTEVRVMHSTKALFIAFRCYDTEPQNIFSTLTKHDRLGDCDIITFLLDPYHDHRTGYYFSTNPHGVQEEGVLYDETDEDDSWDGYWDVATVRDDSGWTAELKIPYSTLRFKNSTEEMIWGMNAFRYISRNKETTYWEPVTRDRGRRVSDFGHLTGLSELLPGTGLELRPYAVADFVEEGPVPLHGTNDWENLGIDAKYRLSSNLTLDATINPDFAQIEADDEVINLSDYPVYLTEKRPFFLEGASIFDSPFELFYSRRITNPEAGGKISGKLGGTRILALAARNLNQDKQAEDFGVLRVQRDVFSRSALGFLVTDKEGPEADYARVWSADGRFKFGQPWALEGQVAQSFKPELYNHNWAYTAEAGYTSDKYSGEMLYTAVQRDFRANDVGWVRYSDFQRAYTWLQYAPRPEKWGIRHIYNNVNIGAETLFDLTHQGHWFNYNNSLQMMNYWWWGFGAEYNSYFRRHYVEEGEAYSLYDSRGQYNFEYYKSLWGWVWFETDFAKPLALAINYSQGDYRDGYEHDVYTTLQVRPRANLELRLQEEYSHIRGAAEINDGAKTDFFVGRLKTEWTLTRKLFTRFTLQYLHDEEAYLTNALLGCNFAPESWFYLVYDDARGELLGWQSVQDRTIKMKVSYFVGI